MNIHLFESCIDELDIDNSVKTAVKQINRICFEAEQEEMRAEYEKQDKASIERSGHGIRLTPEEARKIYGSENASATVSQSDAPKSQAQSIAQTDNTENNTAGNENKADAPKTQTVTKKKMVKVKPKSTLIKLPKEDVELVQNYLHDQRKFKLGVDGKMGPNTIKAIQTSEDLIANGEWNKDTQKAYALILNYLKSRKQSPDKYKMTDMENRYATDEEKKLIEKTGKTLAEIRQERTRNQLAKKDDDSNKENTSPNVNENSSDAILVNKLVAIARKLPRYTELRPSLKEQIENAIVDYRKTKNIKEDKSYIMSTIAAMGDNQTTEVLPCFTKIINGIQKYA